MQSHIQSRKRPAPGSSPFALQSGNHTMIHDVQQATSEPYIGWSNRIADPSVESFSETPGYSNNAYMASPNGPLAESAADFPSNQLVRRTPNHHLEARKMQYENDGWLEDINPQASTTTSWDEGIEEEDLEQKALAAKKDAQVKRKTIPPFVQKLSSFLDESNNTDLIRWSDDGNSFIVLDEDEFANTLIPELFKSNKYASFVRQLNMYGFHKKVGLSDNSMRASEKKNKSPSEFYNPYFKRGRPDLLWLIHKPKSGLIQPKRKKDEKGKLAGDSSDEDKRLAAAPGGSGNSDKGQLKPSEISGDSTHQELATLPSSELVSLRQELQALQRQQRFISKVITQVREQNHQLYQQATAFQALHDRHENSISAILTFLATFYNRNVEGLGTQNLANMFANAIPQTTQQQGTVEDMGEYREGDANTHKLTRVSRRPHLLLPPPTEKSPRISTESPDLGPSQQSHQPNDEQNHQPGKPSGDFHGRPDPSANDIMALIKDANASAAVSPTKHTQGTPQSSFDFPEALSHYQSANGNNPLTAQERDRMLALMAKEQQDSANRQTQTSNNALTTPNPPPMPSLDNFAASQQQLDMLQRLQQEQDAKVQSLADRLQPLSPTGSIPGLNTLPGDGNNLGPPSDLDLNSFISNDDYFTGSNNNIDPGNNLFDPSDFGMDFGGPDNTEFGTTGEFDFGAGDNPSGLDENGWSEGPLVGGQTPDGRGRIVESVSSEATSPAATGTGDEGANDDQGGPQSNNERLKRRRLR